VVVAIAVVLLVVGCAAQAQTKPNILFILTDDQAESTLAYMPNVQNLIQQKGHAFSNAFNAYPLCCPSRATIQRGQYAHNTSVFGNEYSSGGGYQMFDELNREQSTIATWLDAVGYRTIYQGKYMNNFNYLGDTPSPPGWDSFDKPTAPGQTGETGDATTAIRAMAQLKIEAPKVEPFFMMVGFDAPHVANDYESQYEGMFAGERVPRVPSFDEQDVSDKPRYIREDKLPLAQQTDPEVSTVCKDNELNSIEQNDCEYPRQLRNLQTTDRFVKDAVDYLATEGELSNTYIVFYTDNGNHWGEHRLDFGKLAPYETDTGFPLIIRGPSVPTGTTSTKLVGNQDLAPTFAQIGGASTPSFVDGRSFLRIADNDTTNDSSWRTGHYAERRWKTEWSLPSKSSPSYIPPWEAVREENLVYIRYGDDPWTSVNDAGFEEFYDLNTDPYQQRNLAYYHDVPQATLDRLRGRLDRLRGCTATACRAAEDEALSTSSDITKPTIMLTTPPEGASYSLNQAVSANYSCQDELGGSGLNTCAGTVANGAAINTSSAGTKTFSVTATDYAGNTTSVTHTYTAVDNPPPAGCTIIGTTSGETLTGTSSADVICAGGGNDTIKGLGGNDALKGEGGSDQLYGGTGNDTLDGGLSTDTANFSGSLTPISASLATNIATGEGSDTLVGIEHLSGSKYNDTLSGSGANNTLKGNGGADTLNGLDGVDTLDGGGGNDTEHGGMGNDLVVGGSEADNLYGDDGDDTVNSQDGVSGNDSLDGGPGTDTKVTDSTEKSIVSFP
jgi:N-acetylglucosamine-6-sulfatase